MFDAAKDLVYSSNNSNTITSGGYRINKIFGRKKKRNSKSSNQSVKGGGGGGEFNENVGIPFGLLFLQQSNKYIIHPDPDPDPERSLNSSNDPFVLVLPSPLLENKSSEDARDIVSQYIEDDELIGELLGRVAPNVSNASAMQADRITTRKRRLQNIHRDDKHHTKIYARKKTIKYNKRSDKLERDG